MVSPARVSMPPRIKSAARRGPSKPLFATDAAATRFETIFSEREPHCENGFLLGEKESDYLPDFILNNMKKRGWEKFCTHPGDIIISLAREFYANFADREEDKVFVRGKLVPISPDVINEYFHTNACRDLHSDFRNFMTESKYSSILGGIAESGTSWSISAHGKRSLKRASLSAQARIWYHFVQTRLLPTSQGDTIQEERAALTYSILIGVPLDIGKIIMQEIEDCASKKKGRIFFPSLITALCEKAGVHIGPADDRKANPAPIDRKCLKRLMDGVVEQPINVEYVPAAKSDSGKDEGSSRASIAENLEEIRSRLDFEQEMRLQFYSYMQARDRVIDQAWRTNFTSPLPPFPEFPVTILQRWKPATRSNGPDPHAAPNGEDMDRD